MQPPQRSRQFRLLDGFHPFPATEPDRAVAAPAGVAGRTAINATATATASRHASQFHHLFISDRLTETPLPRGQAKKGTPKDAPNSK
jgi:hypothetical protein